MDVVFRADASLLIGSGHVMRCLTLAEELRRHRVACRFICREHVGNLIHLIESRGFPVVRLAAVNHNTAEVQEPVLVHADWLGAHWSQDAAETIDSLAGTIPDWLVVDHYAIDARWETQLKPHCQRLMVIDDLADRRHQCDLLLDQNLVENCLIRYERLLTPSCKTAIGPDYAILGEDYYQARKRVNRKSASQRRVLIYFGSTDRNELTLKSLKSVLSIENEWESIDVVVGQLTERAEAIEAVAHSDRRVKIHKHVPSLSKLMQRADVFIGASGTTTWERCCLGLPSIVFTVAENQVQIAETLAKKGIIIYAGDGTDVGVGYIAKTLSDALKSNKLFALSEKSSQLVDGRGSLYVAIMMQAVGKSDLLIRNANANDEKFLLELANDEEVRKQSFNSELIGKAAHHEWFVKRLSHTKSVRLFIVQIGCYDIGQVRFEKKNDIWEIDYSLVKRVRGCRLAATSLSLAIDAVMKVNGTGCFLAKVKPENTASARVFRSLRFREFPEGGALAFMRGNND